MGDVFGALMLSQTQIRHDFPSFDPMTRIIRPIFVTISQSVIIIAIFEMGYTSTSNTAEEFP